MRNLSKHEGINKKGSSPTLVDPESLAPNSRELKPHSLAVLATVQDLERKLIDLNLLPKANHDQLAWLIDNLCHLPTSSRELVEHYSKDLRPLFSPEHQLVVQDFDLGEHQMRFPGSQIISFKTEHGHYYFFANGNRTEIALKTVE